MHPVLFVHSDKTSQKIWIEKNVMESTSYVNHANSLDQRLLSLDMNREFKFANWIPEYEGSSTCSSFIKTSSIELPFSIDREAQSSGLIG